MFKLPAPVFQAPDPPAPGTTTTTPPAPAPTVQPPAPAPVAPPAAPAAPPIATRPAGQTDADRAAFLEREISNVRAEAAANRVDARTAREQEAAARQELDRMRAEAETRERAAREAGNVELQAARKQIIDAELKAAAVAAGIVDVDLLPLIDRKAITYNSDGTITGINETLTAFKTAKPNYFRAQDATRPALTSRTTTTGSSLPPPPAGAAPPVSSVKDIPKTAEGRAQYEGQKRAALASLRG